MSSTSKCVPQLSSQQHYASQSATCSPLYRLCKMDQIYVVLIHIILNRHVATSSVQQWGIISALVSNIMGDTVVWYWYHCEGQTLAAQFVFQQHIRYLEDGTWDYPPTDEVLYINSGLETIDEYMWQHWVKIFLYAQNQQILETYNWQNWWCYHTWNSTCLVLYVTPHP